MMVHDEIDSEDYLISLPRFSELGAGAFKPGLERVEQLLEALGNPHEELTFVHVGGTNGKGTTASLISSILTAAGYSVGLFTSPHIVSVRERFRIDGEPISSVELSSIVSQLVPVFDELKPSFFEAMTATAFRYFRDKRVDVAVIEVGLGGRLDATNIITPALSVITSISLDHTDLLGDTVEQIAGEKAGIIKAGVPVATSTEGAALNVIRSAAAGLESPIHSVHHETYWKSVQESPSGSVFHLETPVRTYHSVEISVPGRHQVLNSVLAIRSVEILSELLPTTNENIRRGLSEAKLLSGLSARLELVQEDPPIIFDVAHNADGIRAAIDHVARSYSGATIHVAFAMMHDKIFRESLEIIAEYGAIIYPIKLNIPRATSPSTILDLAQELTLKAVGESDIHSFLDAQALDSGVRLVVGSHHLVALAREHLEKTRD